MKQKFQLTSGIVDFEKRIVVLEKDHISLTEQEASLLMYFIDNPERIISKEELLLEVWQMRKTTKKSRVVSQAIKQLRKKIGDSATKPQMLFSVYGQGYRFVLPAQPTPQTPTNLPVSVVPFFGRSNELLYCKDYFATKGRMITILGMGGMGKTSLAMQYASTCREKQEYLGGIYFFDLADISSKVDITQIVSEALNLSLQHTQFTQNVAEIGSYLHECGSCLLVFDNFEQLTAYAHETIEQWYLQSKDAHFMITSRQRLGLVMEDVYELAPFSPEEAYRFFVEERKRFGVKSDPNDQEKEAIQDIVHTLDCIPLALCLAAGRSRLLSIKQIQQRLGNRFQLLRTKGSHPRQATMLAAIEWSWNMLNVTEKSILLQCAVFRGGFDMDAAEQILVLPASQPIFVEDVLQQLLDKSMLKIHRASAQSRLSMYDSIRYFVLEKMPLRLQEETQKRFQEYYLQFVQQFKDQKERHQALAQETNNVQYAWQLLLEQNNTLAAEMLLCFSHFFEIKGWYTSLYRMLEKTMEKTAHEQLPPSIYYQYARVLWRMQQSDKLQTFFDTLPTISDKKVHKEVLNIKANFMVHMGSYAEAEEIIQLLLTDSEPLERAATLILLSGLYEKQYQFTDSQQCSIEAFQIYTEKNISHARIQVMGNLGSEFCLHGNLQQGKEYLFEALHCNQKSDNRFGIALNSINLSTIFLMEHNAKEALFHSYTAISHLQALGNQSIKSIALVNRGMAQVMVDNQEEAHACLQQALEHLHNPQWIAMTQLLRIALKQEPLSQWKKHSNVLIPTSALTTEEWDLLYEGTKHRHAIAKHRKNEDKREIRKTELGIREILRTPNFSIPRQPVESIPNGNVHHRYCILLIENALGARYTKRFHVHHKS